MRSRPALLGASDGMVAASPVSASPDGAAPCSGWIATAVCDATAAPFGRVWRVVTEGSSCHTRGDVDRRLASRQEPRRLPNANLSALLALCDGGLRRSRLARPWGAAESAAVDRRITVT